jgi:hypothetical protein
LWGEIHELGEDAGRGQDASLPNAHPVLPRRLDSDLAPRLIIAWASDELLHATLEQCGIVA